MSTPQRYGAGHAVRRIEDPALVTGRGRFTDDVAMAGQTWLVFVRADRAHARIDGVDSTAAAAVPGVLAVFTGAALAAAGVAPLAVGAAFKRPSGEPFSAPPKRALAHEVVRFVGEPVAAVVAETPDAARAAAALVVVDYSDLPIACSLLQAVAPGAPLVWPEAPGNIAAVARHGDVAATAAAFGGAAHRVQLDIVNQRLAPSTMEPRSVLAYIAADDKLTLRISSQMPTGVRTALADALPGRNAANVRVLVGDVGGGFGMKTGAYPEDIVLGWAALQLQRPVRWQATRLEDFLSAVHGRDQVSRAELALGADGRVRALRVRSFANVGGCPSGSSVVIPLLVGPWVSTSIYDIATVDIQVSAVFTNQAPTGAYRGAGRPEAIYIIERLMDAAARKLNTDPAELRRRNMLRPEQMPHTTPMAQTYDSGDFPRLLDQALAAADWHGFDARRGASLAAGKLRGRGIATFLEWTGAGALDESVAVAVTADGHVELTSATLPMGQGIATSYVQLAHDVFGVPLERIRVLQGDTDRANGAGSAGSRSLFTGGAAVRIASQRSVDEGRQLAAGALEAPAADIEYAMGRFQVAGTDLGIGLFELAARQPGGRFVVSAASKAGAPSWPNGCHIAEVEIDPATGDVQLASYASVNDIGIVVSPTIVRGQVEGGAVQGIGQALCENVHYDPVSGQLLTASYMDYALPRIDLVAAAGSGGFSGFSGFKTAFDQSQPCRTNALGAKGVGELGTIGATPAVVNAVIDALAHSGLGPDAERLQMPLTAEKVWRALRGDLPPALQWPTA